MRRALLAAAISAALLAIFAPGSAVADTCRALDDGGMVFGQINGPEDPEEYCFEVTLGEEQELRQIDERHVQAFYSGGQPSFEITAEDATDAEGATVPTTLTMTGSKVVTLTVHHREGNPLAAWAPFHYPVVAGSGWEGGFHTVEVAMSPAAEQPVPAPQAEGPVPACEVPGLRGRTVKAARRALLLAGCRLGPIRGRRRPGARIVKQYRPYGATLPGGTPVGVKLAR